MEYEIHLEGQARVEKIVEAFDAADALNRFADYLERRDVPAFWQRDAAGVDYLLADGDRYLARPRMEQRRASV